MIWWTAIKNNYRMYNNKPAAIVKPHYFFRFWAEEIVDGFKGGEKCQSCILGKSAKTWGILYFTAACGDTPLQRAAQRYGQLTHRLSLDVAVPVKAVNSCQLVIHGGNAPSTDCFDKIGRLYRAKYAEHHSSFTISWFLRILHERNINMLTSACQIVCRCFLCATYHGND